MILFKDGPAADVALELCRAPLLLRAVQSKKGEWDALDQLKDEPTEDEVVVVYRRSSEPFVVHFSFRNGRGRDGKSILNATYQMVEGQPDDATLRDTKAWRAWCREWAARAAA